MRKYIPTIILALIAIGCAISALLVGLDALDDHGDIATAKVGFVPILLFCTVIGAVGALLDFCAAKTEHLP